MASRIKTLNKRKDLLKRDIQQRSVGSQIIENRSDFVKIKCITRLTDEALELIAEQNGMEFDKATRVVENEIFKIEIKDFGGPSFFVEIHRAPKNYRIAYTLNDDEIVSIVTRMIEQNETFVQAFHNRHNETYNQWRSRIRFMGCWHDANLLMKKAHKLYGAYKKESQTI